jgi:glycosyltransferase involved in cell wall biosynthesis
MGYTTLIERDRVPVIMCTWKRIQRLARTLELLAEQDTPATLYVWNNNRRDAQELDALLTRSPIPVESVHCSRNIGPFGRFYLARELASIHDAVLFIDDDQVFGPSMVADQLASYERASIAGWWAFTYRPNARTYAARDRVASPLEHSDYVGVGGAVADAVIFTDPGLFRCPRRYWYVDDIWLSFYATHVRRWRLRRSLAEFEFDANEHDIDATLSPIKRRMFRYLKRQGWSVPLAGRPVAERETKQPDADAEQSMP